MATVPSTSSVIYKGPKDWDRFKGEFQSRAYALDIWDYIDPDQDIPWPDFTAYTYKDRKYESFRKNLREWYAKLAESGKVYDSRLMINTQREYRERLRQASKSAKKLDEWIVKWQEIMAQGQRHGVPETKTAIIWVNDLCTALAPIAETWTTTFQMVNKKEINNGFPRTLLIRITLIRRKADRLTVNREGEPLDEGRNEAIVEVPIQTEVLASESARNQMPKFVIEDINAIIPYAALAAYRRNVNLYTARSPRTGDVECQACGKAKAKRQIRREPREGASRSGQRIAIDFTDFEEDPEGYRYVMFATDRYLGFIWDIYLKNRKQDILIVTFRYLLGALKN
ncbi:hypothetical protein DL767_010169 [Monosporascus sp. MG133]|nr:hypothetical protein DL767_010169 [Monosporascus sp. MG133]